MAGRHQSRGRQEDDEQVRRWQTLMTLVVLIPRNRDLNRFGTDPKELAVSGTLLTGSVWNFQTRRVRPVTAKVFVSTDSRFPCQRAGVSFGVKVRDWRSEGHVLHVYFSSSTCTQQKCQNLRIVPPPLTPTLMSLANHIILLSAS